MDLIYIFISLLIIILVFTFIFFSFNNKLFPLLLVFFFFGMGIGSFLFNLGVELTIAGLRIESWVWLMVMASLVLGLLSNEKLGKLGSFITRSNFIFYFFYLILLLFNILRTPEISEGIGLTLIKIFPFIAAINFYTNKLEIKDFEKLILFSVAINIFFTIIYVGLGYSIVQFDYTGTPRLTGSMGWASLAYFLIFPFHIYLINFIFKPNNKDLIIVLVFFLLITFTVSRTGILILLLVSLATIASLKKGKFVFISIFGVLFVLSLPFVFDLFYNRFFYTTSSVGIATSGRLTSVEFLFDNFMGSSMKWLIGNGSGFAKSSIDELETFGIQRIHSSIFETIIDVGVLGAIFLLLFCIKFILFFWSYSRKSNLKINMTGSNYINEYKSIVIGLGSSMMLFPLIFLENLYNPFHLAVIFIGITLGYKNVIKLKVYHNKIVFDKKNKFLLYK